MPIIWIKTQMTTSKQEVTANLVKPPSEKLSIYGHSILIADFIALGEYDVRNNLDAPKRNFSTSMGNKEVP